MADVPGAVVFDCDGVLLLSNRLKMRVFTETVRAAGFSDRDALAFGRYVAAHFGTSRARMFAALLAREDLDHRPQVTADDLVARYAADLYALYVRCPSSPGMRGVLAELVASGRPLYIVSGSDQAELRRLMTERGLAGFFEDVFGSPRSKTENLTAILAALADRGQRAAAVTFVGDAEADWRAAAETGVGFVYMDRYSTAKPRMRELAREHGFDRIDDLRALPGVLAERAAAA